MRICPGCRSVYDASSSECPKDGLALIDFSITFPLPTESGTGSTLTPMESIATPMESIALGLSDDDTNIEAGMMVGDYRVEGVIAHGGMGTIYAAIHPLISKRVAIKVLSRRYAQDSEQIARFVLEARAVNQIGHHNIVDIFAIGELNDGRKYLVMELLDGLELNRVLVNVGRFRPGEVLPIYEQLCDGLAAAHSKGFVHRDLKPENVTVLRRHPYPFIKILDFGIAKLRGSEHTAVGTVLGTPEYMAPEQCRAGPMDARVDIYALGVMLYELVSGQKPFSSRDPLRLLAMQTREPPKPPSSVAPVSPELEQVILRSMAKEPAERHQSVRELIEDLRQAIPQVLPWTASLDPPQSAAGERTRTLQPEPAEPQRHDTDRSDTPTPDSEDLSTGPGWSDGDETSSPDSAGSRTQSSGPAFTLEGGWDSPPRGSGEKIAAPRMALSEDDDGATQIADMRNLTPIAVPTGNLLEAPNDKATTSTALDRESPAIAKHSLMGAESTELAEATVVDVRIRLQHDALAATQADGASSPESAAEVGQHGGSRATRRPTPTAIDYVPPSALQDAEKPRRSAVVTGTIEEEATERRTRPMAHEADLPLTEANTAVSDTLHAHRTNPLPTDLALAQTVLGLAPPDNEITLEHAMAVEERADTDELPQIDPRQSDTNRLAAPVDTAADSDPRTPAGSHDSRSDGPLEPGDSHDSPTEPVPPIEHFAQDEKTFHIPRSSRLDRLSPGAIALLLLAGTTLVVGALLLLIYGR